MVIYKISHINFHILALLQLPINILHSFPVYQQYLHKMDS